MSQASRSTKQKNFRLSAMQANRQRIATSANAEEHERERLARLNQRLAADAKPVIKI
jgi:hypothetical protein